MLIDDVEQLKDWLTSSLAPICEADPSALAKYVVALVKKDKTLQDLKDSCVDQLDVFLQTKTKGFVETLFEALDSKVYITKPIKKEEVASSDTTVPDSGVDIPVPTEEGDTVPSSSDQQVVSSTSKVDIKKEEDLLQKAYPIIEKRPKSKSRSVSPRTRSREDDRRRRLDDRPFYDRRYPRRRSPSPRARRFRSRSPVRRRSPFRPIRRSRSPGPRGAGRGRSRSRSWSRSRSRSLPRRSLSRSRSRERVRSRSPGGRFRSRSPRREVRARSPRGRSPFRRSISPRFRSRSPRKRSRSPLGSHSPKSLSPKRSRSGSPIRKVRRNSPDSRGPTPTQENGMVDSTNPTPSHSSISVVSGGRYNEGSASRLRCRDYDEKGFCVRGDLCMYDHGNDPVVVESVPQYPPGPPVSGMPHPPGPPPPPGHPLHMGIPPPGFFANRMPGPPIHVRPDFPQEPYNPEAPGISRRGQPPYWPGMPDGLPPFMKDQPPPISAPNPLPVKARLGNRGDLVTVTVKQERKEQDDDDEIPSSSTRTVIAPKEEAALSVTVAQPPPPGVGVPETMHRPPGPAPPPQANFSQQNRFHPYQRYQHGPRKPFDYNRIGGYRRPDQTNCSLEVRKIPPELNNIAKINEHFGKFGNLTNIQVKYEGDTEAALVTFTNNQEALSCYKCSEPVFNNRFVKVFWHQKNKENGNQEASSVSTTTQNQEDPGASARSRLSTIPPASKMQLNNNLTKKPVETTLTSETVATLPTTSAPTEQSVVYTSSLGGVSKTVYNPSAQSVATAAAAIAAKARANAAFNSPTAVKAADFVSRMEKVKQIEVMKKEAALKKLEIQKHKQELLEKHIEQQKKLIATLEKKDLKESSKKALMDTLKTLSNSIDRMKSELKSVGGHNLTVTIDSSANITPGMKSPEQAKKEILDVELELMTKSTNGEETAELQKKLNELTKVANSMGILARGRGRGTVARGRGATTWVAGGAAAVTPAFGRGRGRGRGAAFGRATAATRTLDRRPKIVEVTGFDVEEKDEITSHLNALKEVEKVDFNMDVPCAIVLFKTRKDAEMGILYGSKFKSKTLKMIWHIPKPDFSRSVSATSIDSDQQEEIDEEALLAGEDEEEEENEERSWRP